MIAATPAAILEQALAWIDDGHPVALVTLAGIEGAASRAPGTQMAVTAAGMRIGSFSGGCIEEAIVAEAQQVLEAGAGRTVRYGLGSPYIDIRLPCGGGIDLMFTPNPSPVCLRTAIERLRQREAVRLFVAEDGLREHGSGFELSLCPGLRLLVAGQGEDFLAFVRLARAYGVQVEAMTPSAQQVSILREQGLDARLLDRPTRLPPMAGDPWTGVVLLFHDRDWEDALLPGLLKLPAFYRGAVGSRRTHAFRLARLRNAGVEELALSSLRGPIGLIPATRDPAALAISVLAELVEEYTAACQTAGRMVAAA